MTGGRTDPARRPAHLGYDGIGAVAAPACRPAISRIIKVGKEGNMPTLGVFGPTYPLWDRGFALDDLGITGVWLSHSLISDELIHRCHGEGARVYAEMGIMSGPRRAHYRAHPEVRPIGAGGQPLPTVPGYTTFACPLAQCWRRQKLAQMEHRLREHELDGLWLDFIRYPGRWERPRPTLDQSCFCDESLARFEEFAHLTVPGDSTPQRAAWVLDEALDSWAAWKCSVIAEFVGQIKGLLRETRPQAMLGMFSVPWGPEDFDNAIQRVIGQDFARLAQHIDIFSPMLYHTMCGRPVEWIGEHTRYLARVTGKPVIPIVQAIDEPTPMPRGEFGKALREGVAGPSAGVMMFRLEDVAGDDEKLTTLQETYGGMG